MKNIIPKDFASLDGFRVYKVKSRGDKGNNDRLYIAPVYIIGLPGDVMLLNKEIKEKDDNIELGVTEWGLEP